MSEFVLFYQLRTLEEKKNVSQYVLNMSLWSPVQHGGKHVVICINMCTVFQ